ncbi:MAG: hypothetical protein JNK30_01495 [Phenylobacterium sp.]|uniref:hypothetical protein n=1 Tax=Phenylobacterium sp. TaxID=1871053 RepID=UPI001A492560|nr:hypothetical protein [Phenylobacterium sp.]MBL8770030.1 hypothetical protein [Phenylobacterium sp.]
MYEQKIYEDPRISLNKLGEYLTCVKASRREKILQDAKYPPTFQVIRYEPARLIIQRYLCGKVPTIAALADEVADYAMTPTKDDFEARMKKSNLEALKLFLEMAPALNFAGAKITIGAHTEPRRPIRGVGVSMRPDLHLTRGGGNEPIRRGAIKLNLSKTGVHSKEAAEYVGALLRTHIEESYAPGECDHEMCFTLDVFSQKLLASPKAVVNRLKDVEAGCAEIARQWADI